MRSLDLRAEPSRSHDWHVQPFVKDRITGPPERLLFDRSGPKPGPRLSLHSAHTKAYASQRRTFQTYREPAPSVNGDLQFLVRCKCLPWFRSGPEPPRVPIRAVRQVCRPAELERDALPQSRLPAISESGDRWEVLVGPFEALSLPGKRRFESRLTRSRFSRVHNRARWRWMLDWMSNRTEGREILPNLPGFC